MQVAKTLIDECFDSWTMGSNANIKTIIYDAFNVDKEGNLNTTRILTLKQYDIKDEKWQRAMEAISESVVEVGSKSYINIYKKDEAGKYQHLNLDISGL